MSKKTLCAVVTALLVAPNIALAIGQLLGSARACERDAMKEFIQQINTYNYDKSGRVQYGTGKATKGPFAGVGVVSTKYMNCSGFPSKTGESLSQQPTAFLILTL